ncbi:hypothetical protein CEXT_354781 [Caerostris extrusa]|uniref:LAGLIDADG homing endonuclease n=1 Tax=Caerostris extrusa TaxID=172846 RepID=A0AAV4S467_CAEEX|nr:hypothetical protein CEXT_354781 [Caerostris extrusa]
MSASLICRRRISDLIIHPETVDIQNPFPNGNNKTQIDKKRKETRQLGTDSTACHTEENAAIGFKRDGMEHTKRLFRFFFNCCVRSSLDGDLFVKKQKNELLCRILDFYCGITGSDKVFPVRIFSCYETPGKALIHL